MKLLRCIATVAAVLTGVVCLPLSASLSARTVVILSSDTLTSTSRTISGAKSVIAGTDASVTFVPMLLEQDPRARQVQLDSVRTLKPAVLLTIGTLATQVAKDNFPATATVFSSVMYPVISGFVKSMPAPGGNITGASLSVPADVQFKYFKRIIPGLKNIGVLYSDNTAPLIPPSSIIAADMGFRLIALPVNNDRELPVALDSLTRICDGIWSVADPNLFSPQSTKYILLNTLRSGIPFMGFSRNVVESGALFALDFDYKAIGRQAGSLVTQILAGARPGDISVTMPDIVWFHYNEQTAKHLSITIPSDLVAVAKEVYR